MPTLLACPICGLEVACPGQHDGPHDELSPVVHCPPTKGTIYVFVKDNFQRGVGGVKTYCSGDAITDPLGFAAFTDLEPGEYPTRIELGESDDQVSSSYYATRTSTNPIAEAGKITMVELVVNRYATLKVVLKRTDDETELPPAELEVGSSNHTPDEPRKPTHDGKAELGKLKPTELYTVTCKLRDEDLKDFALQQAEIRDQRVTSASPTTVTFLLEPRYWVDLALVDPKDETLTGSVSLKQSEKVSVADDVGREDEHVPDLQAGTVDIEGVTLPESREFVGLT